MKLKDFFNTLATGQKEMLRINTPITLGLAGLSALFMGVGTLAADPLSISTGASLATISLTVSHRLGARAKQRAALPTEKQNPRNPEP